MDEVAAATGCSRAAWLRCAAEEQLAYPRTTLAQLARWMHDEGLSSDIGYALEEPWKHQGFIYCAQHGITGAQLDFLQERQRRALERDDLPAGWRIEESTPVDYRVICVHGEVVYDSEAERDGTCLEGCARGCPAPVSGELLQKQSAVLQHADGRPRRWTVEARTPLDHRILCTHGYVAEDSEANRNGRAVPGCPEGCSLHVSSLADAPPALVTSLQAAPKGRRP